MTLDDRRIVLFEDVKERSDSFKSGFETATEGSDLQIEEFAPDTLIESPDVLKPLKEEIQDPTYPLLVVLDQNLRGYHEHDVRRQDVRQMCSDENIPLCIYHRERQDEDEAKRRIEEYEEDVIKFDPSKDIKQLASETANVTRGFREIRDAYLQLKESESSSPIPEILGADETVRSQMDQYAWGNPRTIVGADPDATEDKFDRRFITLLGYWIYNELLRFPGALLNTTATAAYLNVEHEAFIEDEQYHEPLTDALYQGPFNSAGKWWWKPKIDQIRANNLTPEDDGLPDGSEFFERFGCDEIGQSTCQDREMGGDHEARFYGVMMEEPVCEEHSKNPGGWLPMGASRSRVSVAKLAEYEPWMMK